MVEAGFAWLPPLAWRLDRTWTRLRSRDAASDAGRRRSICADNVWLTTQPMEEPEPRAHLRDTIEWIGWDRLLFATDYPHWDFDDPAHALPHHPRASAMTSSDAAFTARQRRWRSTASPDATC